MKQHTVEKGESLWTIAQMHGLSLTELLEANPQITDPNYIMVGEKIFIPHKHVPTPPIAPPGAMPIPPLPPEHIPTPPIAPPGGNPVYPGSCECSDDEEMENICKELAALPRPLIYVVKAGDTLYKIAKCFEISLKELIGVNPHITNPDLIYPGDKIFIPRTKKVMLTQEGSADIIKRRSKRCPNCGAAIK